MLTINLNWEYFLAVIGTLIALAYYANGRFTRLETNVEWLKNAIGRLVSHDQPARKRQRHHSTIPRSKAPRSLAFRTLRRQSAKCTYDR